MYLLKMNWKKFRHLTQVFLFVKVTSIMMEHNFIQYFNCSIIHSKKQEILKKLYHENLKVCQPKNVLPPTSTNNNLFPSIKWYENSNLCLIFKVNYLKQKNATFSPPNIINLFTVCELDTWSKDLNSDFTLKKMLS